MTPRQTQCLESLSCGDKTAKEVANYLIQKRYTIIAERNIAHPRLNELVRMGLVTVIGTKIDQVSKRKVNIYHLI